MSLKRIIRDLMLYQQATYQQATYQQATYQQATYQQATYQQATYQQAHISKPISARVSLADMYRLSKASKIQRDKTTVV